MGSTGQRYEGVVKTYLGEFFPEIMKICDGHKILILMQNL